MFFYRIEVWDCLFIYLFIRRTISREGKFAYLIIQFPLFFISSSLFLFFSPTTAANFTFTIYQFPVYQDASFIVHLTLQTQSDFSFTLFSQPTRLKHKDNLKQLYVYNYLVPYLSLLTYPSSFTRHHTLNLVFNLFFFLL